VDQGGVGEVEAPGGGPTLSRKKRTRTAARSSKNVPKVPEFPASLRIVIENEDWDGIPEFHALQPDEQLPERALGVAVYRLCTGIGISPQKSPEEAPL